MEWKKKGLIYTPMQDYSWRHQNGMCPTPFKLNDTTLRILCTMCDEYNIGRIGYVDVDIENPSRVINISNKPVLDIGRSGTFDDNGVCAISLINNENEIYLYYIGFQLGVKVPYFMFCGLAISNDCGHTFHRYSETPILDRCGEEIYARCGVHVLKDKNIFKMWYIGSLNDGWCKNGEKKLPYYIMRYIESDDGIHWYGNGIPCIEFKDKDEHGFGRPFVWKEKNLYKMYYSIRSISKGYYIGYAESDDGKYWNRKDSNAGIINSEFGWDSINTCYTSLYWHNDRIYMFYNGNNMGKTGFGYAIHYI